jgi:aspartate aminotransferase
MKLSSRSGRIQESATLKVARKALELKAQGVEVADFGAGEPDFDSPSCAVAAAVEGLRTGFTKYTAAAGTPELRQALADRFRNDFGAPWSASQVVVTVGAKTALFNLCLELVETGDEVILPSPTWVSFAEQIRFVGAHPVLVPTLASEGFRVRAEPILGALTPSTRAVLLNSPSNPTGGIIEAEDQEKIVKACAEKGIAVISDETYEFFVYDGVQHASAARLTQRYPDTVILVGSFSKTYAMTGWRLGYAIGPANLMKAMIALQSHSTSNPTSFAMLGALAALQGAAADVQEMIKEYHVRRDLVTSRLAAMPGVSCVAPQGSFYIFPNVSAHYRDGLTGSIAFSEYLLERAQVAVVPGLDFGDDDHIRISFACSRETLNVGLDRLEQALLDLGS